MAELRATRRFTVLDADAVLHEISVDGIPTAERFRAVIVPIIQDSAALSPGATVRAYGEMVDVLWKAGKTLAAARLEILWNSLRTTHRFALLCGYAMGNFYEDAAIRIDDLQPSHPRDGGVGRNRRHCVVEGLRPSNSPTRFASLARFWTSGRFVR